MCEEIEFEIQEEDIPLTMNLEDDVYLVEPKTENLEVTPTKETQYFESETGIYYDNVTVNPIPDNYIEPTGTENITANGTYDIATKASVNVNVPSEEINLQEKSISVATNGSVEVTADSGYTGLSKVNVSNTQELEQISVTPTTEIQTIAPTGNKLINQVNVSAIPSEYIIPSGSQSITENGTYDITNKESVEVNVPEKQLGTKTITSNGTYNATDDNLDGYSQVSVETSGVDINDYFETIYSGTSAASWVSQNFVKKVPDVIIDDSVKELVQFAANASVAPKIICNANVINMNYLYYNNKSENIDISGLNTSNVTQVYNLFGGCSNLTSLDLSNFDSSKINDLSSLFQNCSKLTSLDLSNFDTSIVSMNKTFYGCSNLTNLNINHFDTSKLTDLMYTFYGCSSLTSLDLSSWNTSNVQSMYGTFAYCNKLQRLDIRNFDFAKVTSYNNMFNGVPTDCLIIVKDDTAKTWITSKFTTLTNVKTVAELEAA